MVVKMAWQVALFRLRRRVISVRPKAWCGLAINRSRIARARAVGCEKRATMCSRYLFQIEVAPQFGLDYCTWLIMLTLAGATVQAPLKGGYLHQFILYGTTACHLCEQAETLLVACLEAGAQFDYSSVDISDSDVLFERLLVTQSGRS